MKPLTDVEINNLIARQGLNPERVDLPGELMGRIIFTLTSARSRIEELEGALREIASVCLNNELERHRKLDAIWSIARQALSAKEPVEPKEVGREELTRELRRLFCNFEICDSVGTIDLSILAIHLLSKYTIKERKL